MLSEHLRALEGSVRAYARENGYFGKGIVYAREDMLVGDLRICGGLGDVPMPGSLVRGGEPVCSIYSEGAGQDAVLSSLMDKAAALFPTMRK
jgi:predicted ATP-grasp superfamily ATP-dependent carboligase